MKTTPEDLVDEAPPAVLRLPLAAGAVGGLLFVSLAVAMVSEGRGRQVEEMELPPIVVEEAGEVGKPEAADTIAPAATEPLEPQPRERPRYQGEKRQVSEQDPVLAGTPPVTTPLITKAPPPPSFWIESRRAAAAEASLAQSAETAGGGGTGAGGPETARRGGSTSYGLGGAGDAPLGSDVWAPLLDATSGIWQPRDLDGTAIP